MFRFILIDFASIFYEFVGEEMDFHRLARPRNGSVDLKCDVECLCKVYRLSREK